MIGRTVPRMECVGDMYMICMHSEHVMSENILIIMQAASSAEAGHRHQGAYRSHTNDLRMLRES